MDALVDALVISPTHVSKNECAQWTIFGAGPQVIQTAGPDTFWLYVEASSERKWKAIKRKCIAQGWEIAQDGDDEGAVLLKLPNTKEADYLRSLLGLRKRRGTPTE